jgi:hypothetical protein
VQTIGSLRGSYTNVICLPRSARSRQREQFQLTAADGQAAPAFSFQLVLHGYFFLDAGRQSIEAITARCRVLRPPTKQTFGGLGTRLSATS